KRATIIGTLIVLAVGKTVSALIAASFPVFRFRAYTPTSPRNLFLACSASAVSFLSLGKPPWPCARKARGKNNPVNTRTFIEFLFIYLIFWRWGDGAMGRWGERAMGRKSDGAKERWSDD